MPQVSFSPEWLRQFADPYAVMGLSVAADDRRVLKRYRTVAKLLHPDAYINVDPAEIELASQLLARIVNPAYQRLKQDKGRAETMAMLRFRARRLNREEPLNPQGQMSLQLLKMLPADAEAFYEQAIATLAEQQYSQLEQFEAVTHQLGELNLVYLQLKMGEPLIREKRTGLVAVSETPTTPTLESPPISNYRIDYAERHYQRALTYVDKNNLGMAIQELKDAIKIEASKSEYYALLAKAYLMQGILGAAKPYCRRALELNPRNSMALDCARTLKLDKVPPQNGTGKAAQTPNQGSKDSSSGGLFGLFAKKR